MLAKQTACSLDMKLPACIVHHLQAARCFVMPHWEPTYGMDKFSKSGNKCTGIAVLMLHSIDVPRPLAHFRPSAGEPEC